MSRVVPQPGAEGSEYVRILSRRPEVLETWSQLSATLRFSGLLAQELKEAVRQSTAEGIGCQYCASVGERLGEPDRRTSLAVAVAQLIAEDHGSVDAKTIDVLREEFDEDEIVELLALICFVCIGGQTFGSVIGVEAASEAEQVAYRQQAAARRGP
jgi:alkylhydroperoxidase family enzyme